MGDLPVARIGRGFFSFIVVGLGAALEGS
jgi:hypothetical protein